MDGNYHGMQMLLPDERGIADLSMYPDVTHLQIKSSNLQTEVHSVCWKIPRL